MIVPSAASTPPQNERGSESTRAGPFARPGRSARTSDIRPDLRVAPDLTFHRRAHALGEAAEHHLDPEVARCVVRPLPRVRHNNTAVGPEDRCDVGTRVRDDGDARPLADLGPAPGPGLGQDAAPCG